MVLLLYWSHHSTSHRKSISCSFYARGWVVHQLFRPASGTLWVCSLTSAWHIKWDPRSCPFKGLGGHIKLTEDQQKVPTRTLTIARLLFANNDQWVFCWTRKFEAGDLEGARTRPFILAYNDLVNSVDLNGNSEQWSWHFGLKRWRSWAQAA